MKRAIQLAKMANGKVFPNPFVGAVVVHEGKIIGEGYHEKYGESHAEVRAINQVQDKSILKDCSIYVTLEPCSHFGKTPPCADLIIRHQMRRVVIGSLDPFPAVNGSGILRLQNAGVAVETGVLEQECLDLNKRFFTFHREKRPFVTAKWAESQDGFLSRGEESKGERTIITGSLAHQLVHLQRSQEHAILVGKKTIALDNPQLNVRGVSGPNPIRIVLDSNLGLSSDYQVFQDGQPTVVLNTVRQDQNGAVRYIRIDDMEVSAILQAIYDLGILSVYIEGGSETLNSFLKAKAVDQIYRFIGSPKLERGIGAPQVQFLHDFDLVELTKMQKDRLEVYRKKFNG